MEQRFEVFVSYKSLRWRSAKHFSRIFKAYGFKVWFDHDLSFGGDWQSQIERRIDEAGVVVVIWTKEAVDSRWVNHEASRAGGKFIGIYFDILDQKDREKIKIYEKKHHVNLETWNGNPNDTTIIKLISDMHALAKGAKLNYTIDPEGKLSSLIDIVEHYNIDIHKLCRSDSKVNSLRRSAETESDLDFAIVATENLSKEKVIIENQNIDQNPIEPSRPVSVGGSR